MFSFPFRCSPGNWKWIDLCVRFLPNGIGGWHVRATFMQRLNMHSRSISFPQSSSHTSFLGHSDPIDFHIWKSVGFQLKAFLDNSSSHPGTFSVRDLTFIPIVFVLATDLEWFYAIFDSLWVIVCWSLQSWSMSSFSFWNGISVFTNIFQSLSCFCYVHS